MSSTVSSSELLHYKKHQLKRCKTNSRIRWLSQPKYYQNKFVKNKFRRHGRNIEIIREPNISTRLEQLALRPVRHLIAAKEKYGRNRFLKQHFNKYIQKSMYSLYSRLANIKLPKIPVELKKWNENDWKKHNEWLLKRAMPKQYLQRIEKLKKKIRKKNVDMIRIERLSEPRRVLNEYYNFFSTNPCKPIRPVSKSALKYSITDRIMDLSRPLSRKKYSKEINEEKLKNPIDFSEELKPSSRILKLAKAKSRHADTSRIKMPISFPVSRTALKYKITPKLDALSVPIMRPSQPKSNRLPSGVAKSGLYKLTPAREFFFADLSKRTAYVKQIKT